MASLNQYVPESFGLVRKQEKLSNLSYRKCIYQNWKLGGRAKNESFFLHKMTNDDIFTKWSDYGFAKWIK